MKLPPFKRILREDVKEAPPWILKIIDSYNSLAENVYQALNRNITLTENVKCMVKELNYITPSSYPTMDDVSFVSTLNTKAIGVLLMQAVDNEVYEPVTGVGNPPWTEVNGSIVVKPIPGLAASKTYTIRLVVF